MSDTDPTDAPELKYLGEVQPGKSYLLRATEPLPPQTAMRAREQLERTFPGSTFAILSHTWELVEPKPATELVTVLRDTALKYQRLATKMEPGPSRAAAQIVGNALLDVWHALMTAQAGDGAATPPAGSSGTPVATGEEPTDESATGALSPESAPSPRTAECHESPFDGAPECILPAYHADHLHQDAYGNRWSW